MSDELSEESDDEFWPKTMDEAIEAFLSSDTPSQDIEIICEYPRSRLDWMHANFGHTIREACSLDEGNKALLKACGSEDMSPNEASRVIMEKIWEYFHPSG